MMSVHILLEPGSRSICKTEGLEAIAKMALLTLVIGNEAVTVGDRLLSKHFQREHGPERYSGLVGA